MYAASTITIKISLLLLYYRLFRVIRWFRWLLVALCYLNLVYLIASVAVKIFQCSPVTFDWDVSILTARCINQDLFYRWSGVTNLLLDFIVWSLTMPVIWQMKLSIRQKLYLSVIFLIGLLSVSLRAQLFRRPHLYG